MSEPFTDQELLELADRQSQLVQHMDQQVSRECREDEFQNRFLRNAEVSQQNNAASVNDARYKAEFKAGTYKMSEDQFVSLRRAEDGLEEFLPNTPPVHEQASTHANPLASGL